MPRALAARKIGKYPIEFKVYDALIYYPDL